MFPAEFVRQQVELYSRPDDWVFDPFCGRGTTVLESLLMGRRAAGSDTNPVAFCVSRAKAEPPTVDNVQREVARLEEQFTASSSRRWERERAALPPFFRRAFHATTLRELLYLRATLDWRRNRTQRFVAAMVLGSLHGEMDRSDAYFSNQMPRTICLKPGYSLRYWRRHRLFPKRRRVFEMLGLKARQRLDGLPAYADGAVRLADARSASSRFRKLKGRVALLVTSPPYLTVTRYEEDQWLRIWFLGGEPRPTSSRISRDDRHTVLGRYWQFLRESWAGVAPLMAKTARLAIRLGGNGAIEQDMTGRLVDSLKSAFGTVKMVVPPRRTRLVRRQTMNFNPDSSGCRFEVDYVFSI
jgi:hypothetical protein